MKVTELSAQKKWNKIPDTGKERLLNNDLLSLTKTIIWLEYWGDEIWAMSWITLKKENF